MVGNRIERRDAAHAQRPRPAGAARPVVTARFDAADRVERPANSLDRYSLALQLIQVFPIVSGVTLALGTDTWLARALAAAVLLTGTGWVVWQDRGRRHARREEQVRRVPARQFVVARADERTASTVAAGPAPAAFRRRYRRRRLREVRNRPAPARPELPRPGRVTAKRNPAPSRNDSRGC